MRNPFRAGMTGTRSLIAVVVVLGALVAAYGALVLPHASTSAREAAPADTPIAVLASSREAERGDGCSSVDEDDVSDAGVTLRVVT
jgi:hypothetical protein